MAGDVDEWTKEQLKPLSMFELAKWWADGIKLVGAGNGAGVLASGAALNAFHGPHAALIWVKISGTIFFVGVFAFALSYFFIHAAAFAQDEVAHAARLKDKVAININSATSRSSMTRASTLAMVATAAFFLGCTGAFVAFLLY